MRTAAEWAHIRQGILTQRDNLTPADWEVRAGLIEDFIKAVQRDVLDMVGPPSVIEALDQVRVELASSMARFKPMNSAHEGYAVLAEEVDELWDEIKVNQSRRDWAKIEKECIQVAAMAVRLLLDVVRAPGRGHEKITPQLRTECRKCGKKLGALGLCVRGCDDPVPTTYRTAPPGTPLDASLLPVEPTTTAPNASLMENESADVVTIKCANGVDHRMSRAQMLKVLTEPWPTPSPQQAQEIAAGAVGRALADQMRKNPPVVPMTRQRNADDMGMPP